MRGITPSLRRHPWALIFKITSFAANEPGNYRYQNEADDSECHKDCQDIFGESGAEKINACSKRYKPAGVHNGNILPEYLPEIASFSPAEAPGSDDSVSARAGPGVEMLAISANKTPEHDDGSQTINHHEYGQRLPDKTDQHSAEYKQNRRGNIVQKDKP